ncbi:MAG: hypothetical protein SGARI_001831 [Bacillariaceae sp.]
MDTKSIKKRLAPHIQQHHGERALNSKMLSASDVRGHLNILGKPNVRRTKASTQEDHSLVIEKLGQSAGGHEVSFDLEHQRSLQGMSFTEYCSASIAPYAQAGYTCACDSELEAAICSDQQEGIFRYVIMMYDSFDQGHSSGIDCLCADVGCETPGNVCVQIFTNVNNEPYCVQSDIAVSGSECSSCNMCSSTEGVYVVEIDECIGVGIGSDPIGCFNTALLTDQLSSQGSSEFQVFCDDTIPAYSADGFDCECDGEDLNVICSKTTFSEAQILLIAYDERTQGSQDAIDCRCPDFACEASPSTCYLIGNPESAAPSCLVFDLADPNLTECTQCRMCTSSNNGFFRMEADKCDADIAPGCIESTVYGDFVALGTPSPSAPPASTAPVAAPSQPPALATQAPVGGGTGSGGASRPPSLFDDVVSSTPPPQPASGAAATVVTKTMIVGVGAAAVLALFL